MRILEKDAKWTTLDGQNNEMNIFIEWGRLEQGKYARTRNYEAREELVEIEKDGKKTSSGLSENPQAYTWKRKKRLNVVRILR